MNKVVKTYLTEDTSEKFNQLCKAKGISVSSYIGELVTGALNEAGDLTGENDEDDSEISRGSIHVHLSDKDAELLSDKAKKIGISPTAYVRRLIKNNDLMIYDISTDDVRDYIAELHGVTVALTSMVNLIKRSGKGEIFAQDVEAIKKYSKEIVLLMNKQVAATYTTRKQIIREELKKIKKDKSTMPTKKER